MRLYKFANVLSGKATDSKKVYFLNVKKAFEILVCLQLGRLLCAWD